MKKLNKFKLMIVMLTLILMVSGCQKETTAETTTSELDKITFVLDWLPNTNHTGIYTAIEKGYFADENLEVEVIQPQDGDAEVLVANGKADFGISFQETITMARTAENPIPVVAIAAVLQHNTSGFASLAAKNIVTPKDFENKVYGSWGTEIEDAFIKTLMAKDEADFSKLDVVNIESYDFLTSITNDVDFQWIYYGWDGVAAEAKGVDLNFIKLQDIDPDLDFYTPVIMTSDAMINDNPELVKRFLRAVSKGYEDAANNPDDAVLDLLANAPELDEEIATLSQEYLADEYISDAEQWGVMKSSVWETFGQWMYDNGVISQPLDVDAAFTNEFLPNNE